MDLKILVDKAGDIHSAGQQMIGITSIDVHKLSHSNEVDNIIRNGTGIGVNSSKKGVSASGVTA